MSDPVATVYVVDDDPSIRRSLTELAHSVHLAVRTFDTAQAFLDAYDGDTPGCLLLDVRMPGMSGLDLQQRMQQNGWTLPIIFVSGHGDVEMAVDVIKKGAVDFIEKPVKPQDLLDRIHRSIELDASRRRSRSVHANIARKLAKLTARERQVLDLVVAGKLNKDIAEQLNISKRTVEIHRNQVMRKMDAACAIDLVKMVLTHDKLSSKRH